MNKCKISDTIGGKSGGGGMPENISIFFLPIPSNNSSIIHVPMRVQNKLSIYKSFELPSANTNHSLSYTKTNHISLISATET